MKNKILVVYENEKEQRFLLDTREQFEWSRDNAVGFTVRLATDEEKETYTLHPKQNQP